jgi:hypothetical protein
VNIKNFKFFASFAVVLPLFIFISASLQFKMNKIKVTEKLTDAVPVENAPPVIAFTTVALGSFRGILADMLWLRMIRLQDEGQYFEMVQLASWITKLQPRFTSATAYLAWNMAYNISVTCSSFEDRWRWINKGIELIRDEAMNYNPSDPLLYKELGWIYQHKLGNIMDDANIYYKSRLASEMMKVLGNPKPEWEALATASDNLDDLGKMHPQIGEAMAKTGFSSMSNFEITFRNNGNLSQEFIDTLADDQIKTILENSLRKRWLKQAYKLNPGKILMINKKYGVLDWRLPEAHAIYWATIGIEYDKAEQININCDRMITQSLKEAFMAGRVLIMDKDDYRDFMTVPNLELADTVKKTFEDAYERQKSNSFRSALENFMVDAAVLLYNFGRYQKAQEYLESLRKLSPNNIKFKLPLDKFVLMEWTEDVQSSTPRQAMDIIGGLLFRSCYLLAGGDNDAAAAHEKLAALVYKKFFFEQKGAWGRTGLPPYDKIKKDITLKCLENFPPNLSLVLKNALKIIQSENKQTPPAFEETTPVKEKQK